MSIDFISIPVIALVVGLIMQFYKKVLAKGRENFIKAIPIIGIVLGIGFGLLTFYTMPELIPATTWYSAVFMGAASGATATGVHQVVKQYLKTLGDAASIEVKTGDEDKK